MHIGNCLCGNENVKVFPKNIMLNNLSNNCDILCTHPMFGPDSAKKSWQKVI